MSQSPHAPSPNIANVMVPNIAENPSLRYPAITHITTTGNLPTANRTNPEHIGERDPAEHI